MSPWCPSAGASVRATRSQTVCPVAQSSAISTNRCALRPAATTSTAGSATASRTIAARAVRATAAARRVVAFGTRLVVAGRLAARGRFRVAGDRGLDENQFLPNDRRGVAAAGNQDLPADVFRVAPFNGWIGLGSGARSQGTAPLRPALLGGRLAISTKPSATARPKVCSPGPSVCWLSITLILQNRCRPRIHTPDGRSPRSTGRPAAKLKRVVDRCNPRICPDPRPTVPLAFAAGYHSGMPASAPLCHQCIHRNLSRCAGKRRCGAASPRRDPAAGGRAGRQATASLEHCDRPPCPAAGQRL